jgi:hypothetical protein
MRQTFKVEHCWSQCLGECNLSDWAYLAHCNRDKDGGVPDGLIGFLTFFTVQFDDVNNMSIYPIASSIFNFTYYVVLVGVKHKDTMIHAYLICYSFTWLITRPFEFLTIFNHVNFLIQAMGSVVLDTTSPLLGNPMT